MKTYRILRPSLLSYISPDIVRHRVGHLEYKLESETDVQCASIRRGNRTSNQGEKTSAKAFR